jgi:hypothetical protein
MPGFGRKGAIWTIVLFAVPIAAVSIVAMVMSHDVIGNLGWLVFAGVFAALGVRVLQCGVRIESNDVVVRNINSTKRIALASITGVEPQTEWGANKQHGWERRVFIVAGDQRVRVDALASNSAMARKDNAELLRSFLKP